MIPQISLKYAGSEPGYSVPSASEAEAAHISVTAPIFRCVSRMRSRRSREAASPSSTGSRTRRARAPVIVRIARHACAHQVLARYAAFAALMDPARRICFEKDQQNGVLRPLDVRGHGTGSGHRRSEAGEWMREMMLTSWICARVGAISQCSTQRRAIAGRAWSQITSTHGGFAIVLNDIAHRHREPLILLALMLTGKRSRPSPLSCPIRSA